MRLLSFTFVSLLTAACIGILPQAVSPGLKLEPPAKLQLQDVTVQILVRDRATGNDLGGGSGVIIKSSKDLYMVLTAKHVVETGPHLEVDIIAKLKGNESAPARHIVLNEKVDAAILTFSTDSKMTEAQMGTDLTPEKKVITAGFPLGFQLILAEGMMCFEDPMSESLWICTAPTFPGNSGGGVFDAETRKLLGINCASPTYHTPRGSQIVTYINFFLPISEIKDWIKETENILFR